MAIIGIINCSSGNVLSLYNALEYLNIQAIQINDWKQLNRVSHIILPGVGTFGGLMTKLEYNNLKDELCIQLLEKNKPYLGICVGMQVLATSGNEYNFSHGLDIVKGTVEKLPITNSTKFRLPHIGWNDINIVNDRTPLFKNIHNGSAFYFIHSFHFVEDVQDRICKTSSCNYYVNFTASVQKNNIFGVQFHPEKSQQDGLQLLKNFSEID